MNKEIKVVYQMPRVEILEVATELLASSGPDACDIGSPSVRYNSKSIWDEESEDNKIIDYEI